MYRNSNTKTPMSPSALIYALGFDTNQYKGKMTNDEIKERIEGNLCDCKGSGRFVLLPVNDPDVQQDHRRYMQCKCCGGWSNL